MQNSITIRKALSVVMAAAITVSAVVLSVRPVSAVESVLPATETYDSFAVGTANEKIKGSATCLEITDTMDHTNGTGNSRIVNMRTAANINAGYTQQRIVLNDGNGDYFNAAAGVGYKVTFWAYMERATTDTQSKFLRLCLGSANSADIGTATSNKTIESTSVNGGAYVTSGDTGCSFDGKINQWVQVTAQIQSCTNTGVLTMSFHTYSSIAYKVYIDDVTIEPILPTFTIDFENANTATFYANTARATVTLENRICQIASENDSNKVMRMGYSANNAAASTPRRSCFRFASSNTTSDAPFSTVAGSYYRVTFDYKVEKLTCDAQLILELGTGGVAYGIPTTRYAACPMVTLKATDTAGEWSTVSALISGYDSANLIIALGMKDQTARMGSYVLVDNLKVETIAQPGYIGYDLAAAGETSTIKLTADDSDEIDAGSLKVYNFDETLNVNSSFGKDGIATARTGFREGGDTADEYTFTMPSDGKVCVVASYVTKNSGVNIGGLGSQAHAEPAVQGGNTAREVSSDYNSTTPGSKSLKMTMADSTGLSSTEVALKRNIAVLNFGNKNYKAVQGKKYTVTFKAYLKPDNAATTGTKFVRMSLGSSNSQQIANGATVKVESTSVDGGATNAKFDVGKTLTIGAWTDVKLEVASLAGEVSWTDTFITIDACIYSYPASLYIDDVVIVADDDPTTALTQNYEGFAAKTFAVDNNGSNKDGLRFGTQLRCALDLDSGERTFSVGDRNYTVQSCGTIITRSTIVDYYRGTASVEEYLTKANFADKNNLLMNIVQTKYYDATADCFEYVGGIKGLSVAHYDFDFVARGYVEALDQDGVPAIFYGDVLTSKVSNFN